MRRWLLLPPLFLLGMFAAMHATAATHTQHAAKATNASSTLVNLGGGQFKWNVTQLSPDSPISNFTLVPGSAFAVASVVSVSQPGSCSVSGRNVNCNVPLMDAPCMCQPGGSVDIVLQASGDPSNSVLQVNGATFAVQTFGGGTTTTTATTTTQTTTSTPPPTTTTTKTTPPPPKKKVVPKCKKGQKSTKKHPCHK